MSTSSVTAPPYLTDAHERLRQLVREFAETEVTPRVQQMETSGAVESELAVLIARQGWIGVTIDPNYGGMGAGHLAKTILLEELSRASGAAGAIAQASQLGAAKIIHFGTEEQRRTWLPAIAAGECLPTIAVTEPGSGGHVLGTATEARRRKGEYVLNGRKIFVGNSHIGHVHGVIARTGSGSNGLSAFLVESDRKGVSLGAYRPALGLRGFSFGEVILDQVRIPATNRIGEEGDGLAIAYSSSILYGRPNLTAVALGLHQAVVDETVHEAQTRHRYNQPLAKLGVVRQKIGLLRHRLTTARLLAYDASHRLDLGHPCDEELINAKYYNVEACLDSARAAMEIWGAAGLLADNPIERLLRDAYCIYPPAGTGDIQLYRLAEIALDAYRGQWSQYLADQLKTPSPHPA